MVKIVTVVLDDRNDVVGVWKGNVKKARLSFKKTYELTSSQLDDFDFQEYKLR